ncbi:MAG: hypothetical protein JXR35_05665 [Rhodobacteraceae bacterium]|nr:hypothetical protein [Paracoccaceae bacterium]
MKRPSFPGPRFRADTPNDPPLNLRDIVDALCTGALPSSASLEMALDRIEGAKR